MNVQDVVRFVGSKPTDAAGFIPVETGFCTTGIPGANATWGERCQGLKFVLPVIPAQAGIQRSNLDSRLRGNDGTPKSGLDAAAVHRPVNHRGKPGGEGTVGERNGASHR